MSVGFVGSSYQSVADINGSGARLDVSLQSVLNKYDSIATDLDRLANSATFNVYDTTARQKYGNYNSDSQNGWAESWYSEYKAVLQMRADALKKKLSVAYNRVLEKSVYTEIDPDNTSVFAPYANRTASLTQTDYQTPISEILVRDVAIGGLAAVAPPATPTVVNFPSILDYLKAPSTKVNPTTGSGAPNPSAPKITIDVPLIDPSSTTGSIIASSSNNPLYTTPTQFYTTKSTAMADSQAEALYNAISDAFVLNGIPNPPVTNTEMKNAKIVADSIISLLAVMNTPQTVGGQVFHTIDVMRAYSTANGVKNLLGTPITLPASIATIIPGYQADAYYTIPAPVIGALVRKNDGTFVTWPETSPGVLLPAPTPTTPVTSQIYIDWVAAGLSLSGVYPNSTTTPTAINTASLGPQNQNAGLSGNGYLYNVDLSSLGITVNGTTATGTATTSTASICAFTLNSPSTLPTAAVVYPNNTPAYSTPLTATDITTAAADFIDYGTATASIPITTIYIDDLDIGYFNSSISAHIKTLLDNNQLRDESGATVPQLPPAKGQVVFKSRFPTSWYVGGDPRLGLLAGGPGASPGVGTPSSATTTFISTTNHTDRGGADTTPLYAGGPTSRWHTSPDGIYTMLMAACPDLNLSQTPLPVTVAPTMPATTVPMPTNAPYPNSTVTYEQATADGSGSYEKPIGDADLNSGKSYSNLRVEVPEYGTGVNSKAFTEVFSKLPDSVKDTMIKNPSVMADFATSINDMANSFIGRQYDDIVQGNFYDGQFTCTDTSPLFGLKVSGVGISGLELTYGGGMTGDGIEKYANSYTSASLLYAGSASVIGATTFGSIGATSGGVAGVVGVGPDINFGHLSAINDAANLTLPIPTVGLASGGIEVGIPITIYGITFTFFGGARHQQTRDIAAEFVEKFLAAVKPLVVEAIQTQAYSASSGTAFDTYASRAEYHFNNPGYLEAMKKLTVNIFGIEIPIGSLINDFVRGGGLASIVGLVGSGAGWTSDAYGTDVNGVSAGARMFDYQHAVQGAETRETESGGFFATQSFLSQFQLKNMESNYWIGTQQNEELMNNDMLRSLQTAGGQLLDIMMNTISAVANPGGTNSGKVSQALNTIFGLIRDMDAAKKQEMWFKLLYGDLSLEGTGLGQESYVTGEGFNYAEPDHKPFEGDSDFNYPEQSPPSVASLLNSAFGGSSDLFKTHPPDFIMDGYSSTMRFRKATDAAAGMASTIANSKLAAEHVGIAALTPTVSTAVNGYGPRGYAGRGGAYPSTADNGFWNDTALGTTNEVYVGTRKVIFNNLDQGFGAFETATITDTTAHTGGSGITDTGTAGGTSVSDILGATRKTYASADRYIGADTRAFGKRYDAVDPINFESFNTAMYNNTVTGIGPRYHYDRRNQYSLSFQSAASNNVVNLQGSQALNPSIGGFIKMAEIDKNKTDDVLLQYESVSQTTLMKTTSTANNVLNLKGKARGSNEQKFGGSADGKLNELNQVLYEAMHLRADGRNLSEFNQYRDVFNMGYMKNFFVSGQSYHPTGGGVTSSIEIRYDTSAGTSAVQSGTILGVTGTREDYNHDKDGNLINFDPYNTLTLNKSRGKASVYLNNYFAYKKRANKK